MTLESLIDTARQLVEAEKSDRSDQLVLFYEFANFVATHESLSFEDYLHTGPSSFDRFCVHTWQEHSKQLEQIDGSMRASSITVAQATELLLANRNARLSIAGSSKESIEWVLPKNGGTFAAF